MDKNNKNTSDLIILGIGIAGLSAAYHVSKNNINFEIFEKKETFGGLLRSIKKNGFTFDRCTHLSFTDDDYVKSLFAKTPFYTYNLKPKSIKGKIWSVYPIVDNLNILPIGSRLKIIFNYLFRKRYKKVSNYYEWLLDKYGKILTTDYFLPYTTKYWVKHPSKLNTDWVGNRLPKINLWNLLKSSVGLKKKSSYYINELRYPQNGGFKSFLNSMKIDKIIKYGHEVIKIDLKSKLIKFSNGQSYSYNKIISSLPLPEYNKLIVDLPSEISSQLKHLEWTSVFLVSIGYKIKYNEPNCIWFYIYDDSVYASRAYFTHKKSPNNAPNGYGGIQFEIYFNWNDKDNYDQTELIENCVSFCTETRIFDEEYEVLSFNKIKYANIIMNEKRELYVKNIKDYLERFDFHTIGRYGEWDYLWSDGSLLSGKEKGEQICEKNI